MRTLVIGLDGVCGTVLEPLVENEIVPTIAKLAQRSAVGQLESQLPPWTPSAWPSMYTGVNPGKHGVYDFLHFEGYDWDVVNRSHVKEFAVWELLSMRGFSSVIVNVPATYPPREFDGALVPGYLAPANPEGHPPGIWDELDRKLGGYSLYGNTLDTRSADEALARDLVRLTTMRGEAFRYLLDEYHPDFGFVQFQSTDTVFHEFPDDRAVIREVYRAVDHEIALILERCNPEVTLLISDHGLGPMPGYEFRVNDFLRQHGYVDATAAGPGMPSWKSRTRLENGNWSTIDRSLVARAIEMAARGGITSQRIGAVLRKLGLEEWALNTVPVDLIRAGTEQVDFSSSRAYMRARTEMGLRLNLVGREPDGLVPQEQYEQVRAELIECFRAAETPDGEPVFEAVYPREEIFDGPYVEDAPDILLVPNRFDHFLVGTLKGDIFGQPTESWEHKLDGIVMASGPEIDPATDLEGAHLFDITPTILATFGLGIGDRMDGRPLRIIDGTDCTAYPPFQQDDVQATEDAAVVERLADLGYLE